MYTFFFFFNERGRKYAAVIKNAIFCCVREPVDTRGPEEFSFIIICSLRDSHNTSIVKHYILTVLSTRVCNENRVIHKRWVFFFKEFFSNSHSGIRSGRRTFGVFHISDIFESLFFFLRSRGLSCSAWKTAWHWHECLPRQFSKFGSVVALWQYDAVSCIINYYNLLLQSNHVKRASENFVEKRYRCSVKH